MLSDVLDLDREDIAKIPGMTPETTDQLLAFLAELTDEDSTEEARPAAMSRLLGLLGLGMRGRLVVVGRGGGSEGIAGRDRALRGARGRREPARGGQGGPAGCRPAVPLVAGPDAAAIGAQLGRPR